MYDCVGGKLASSTSLCIACLTDVPALASRTPRHAEHASDSQATGHCMGHPTTTGSALEHAQLSDGEINEFLTELLFQPHGMRGTQRAAGWLKLQRSLNRTKQTWSRRWGCLSLNLQPTTTSDIVTSSFAHKQPGPPHSHQHSCVLILTTSRGCSMGAVLVCNMSNTVHR